MFLWVIRIPEIDRLSHKTDVVREKYQCVHTLLLFVVATQGLVEHVFQNIIIFKTLYLYTAWVEM